MDKPQRIYQSKPGRKKGRASKSLPYSYICFSQSDIKVMADTAIHLNTLHPPP